MIAETKDERGGLPSASSMDRAYFCGASHLLEKGMPDQTSAQSQRGTRIHDVMAGILKMDDVPLGDAKTADIMMNEEAALIDKFSFEGTEIHREERFWFSGSGLEPIASAKPDVVHLLPSKAMVINYKSGFGDQTPIERNWQINTEAVCVYTNFHVKELRMVILQPFSKPMSVTRFIDEMELKDLCAEVEEVSLRAMIPGQTPIPGSHCVYCRAKPICEPFKAFVDEVVKNQKGTNLWYQPPSDRGQRLAVLKMAEKVIKAEMEIFRDILEKDSNGVTGYKLIPGKRKIFVPSRSLLMAIKALEEIGIPMQEYLDISVAQAAEALWTLGKTGEAKKVTKEAARSVVEVALLGLTETKYDKKSIVEA